MVSKTLKNLVKTGLIFNNNEAAQYLSSLICTMLYRQRWQAPDVPAELAKRIICACIREICFLEILWGLKDKIFLDHFWLGIFTQDNLHNTSRQPGKLQGV